MTRTEEEIQKTKQEMIEFIEGLKVKDTNGNLVDFKLNNIQKKLLELTVRNGFKNFQIVWKGRIK